MRIAFILTGLITAGLAIWSSQAAAPANQSVAVAFVLTAGGKEVGCGAPLTDLGTSHLQAKLDDARMYIHDLQLIDIKGKRVPVAFARDDWQFANVSLLDFKDARGGNAPCNEKAPAKNTSVTGTVPQGNYAGLEFSVGVPVRADVDGTAVSLNHSNTETAPPPLDIAAMGWSWQAGRRFLSIDIDPAGGITKPDGSKARTWFAHLGSTGCTGNPATGQIVSCARPNRFTVTLDHFDPRKQKVALDLTALFRNNDLSIDKGGAVGCMSGFDDPDCAGIFEQLGLNLNETHPGAGDAGTQRQAGVSAIFMAEPKS